MTSYGSISLRVSTSDGHGMLAGLVVADIEGQLNYTVNFFAQLRGY